MLPAQMKLLSRPIPPCFRQWVNIKHAFEQQYRGVKASGMPSMLRHLRLPLVVRSCAGSRYVIFCFVLLVFFFECASLIVLILTSAQGRHHSGIDDARNITAILRKMIQDGCVVRLTWNGH